MLRIVGAILLVAATAAGAAPAALPYFPCNSTTRGLSTLDLIKYSGTWFNVATTIPNMPNDTDSATVQAKLNRILGCSRNRFDLSNANNLNITQDITFRQKINDTSMFPPDTVFTNGNEARFNVPARPANSATPNDAHWIMDAYSSIDSTIMIMPDPNKTTESGTVSIDVYNIATNYKDWGLWYICTAPPNVAQVEQWGVWSRAPKPYNAVKKFGFKTLARLAGIDIAFSDYLYDIPQDLCF